MSLVGLLGVCQWLEETALSVAIRESAWVFPVIESIHVLSLCLLGMAVLVDLRLLNVALKGLPIPEVTAQLKPWVTAGVVVAIVSGVLVFVNSPVEYYTNTFFRLKVIMLMLIGVNAWLFRAGVWRRMAVTCSVSLILWAGVVVAGGLISYHLLDAH